MGKRLSMNKKVVIIGAGGHGRVVADIAKACGDTVIGFLDDSNTANNKVNIIGTSADAVNYCDGETELFVAIGNCKVREKIMNSLSGAKWYTAIHPSAVISPSAVIGEGTCVMPNAVVNNGAVVGKGVIINTCASVDHDDIIGDYVHIACGARLAGTVTVGNCTWIGIGSTISNNVSVCSNLMIGAGAVVVKDITEEGTYVGVPAKKVR